MAENVKGLYAALNIPALFTGFHRLVVRGDARRILVDSYIKPQAGDRLLDIGCGPASMLPYLNDVIYTGLDLERNFIELARAEYGERATFIHARAQDLVQRLFSEFDIAIAIGILHHLDDEEARELFRAAEKLLKPGGRLIVSDPVSRLSQNPIARLVMRFDRGKSIRSKEGYLALAGDRLQLIRTDLRSDFLRIPYDHCISVYEKRSQ
jgi:2-polyprenyl-3-methyl-5-hydroxy-6-metoxy-1,4-benzoquinol methylase